MSLGWRRGLTELGPNPRGHGQPRLTSSEIKKKKKITPHIQGTVGLGWGPQIQTTAKEIHTNSPQKARQLFIPNWELVIKNHKAFEETHQHKRERQMSEMKQKTGYCRQRGPWSTSVL